MIMVVVANAPDCAEFLATASNYLAINVLASGAYTTWKNVLPVVCKVSEVDARWIALSTPYKCICGKLLLAVLTSFTVASVAQLVDYYRRR